MWFLSKSHFFFFIAIFPLNLLSGFFYYYRLKSMVFSDLSNIFAIDLKTYEFYGNNRNKNHKKYTINRS